MGRCGRTSSIGRKLAGLAFIEGSKASVFCFVARFSFCIW
jgi:hypothetical protein